MISRLYETSSPKNEQSNWRENGKSNGDWVCTEFIIGRYTRIPEPEIQLVGTISDVSNHAE